MCKLAKNKWFIRQGLTNDTDKAIASHACYSNDGGASFIEIEAMFRLIGNKAYMDSSELICVRTDLSDFRQVVANKCRILEQRYTGRKCAFIGFVAK